MSDFSDPQPPTGERHAAERGAAGGVLQQHVGHGVWRQLRPRGRHCRLPAARHDGVMMSYSRVPGIALSLGTIKASQVVILNEDSVVVTQRKLM